MIFTEHRLCENCVGRDDVIGSERNGRFSPTSIYQTSQSIIHQQLVDQPLDKFSHETFSQLAAFEYRVGSSSQDGSRKIQEGCGTGEQSYE